MSSALKSELSLSLQTNIADYLQQACIMVNEHLDKLLPAEETYPHVIHQAMRYSVFVGGKRLRPILTLAVCQACGGKVEQALNSASALEMIHAYSLIHDDLPAMDNDDYRRGQLSNHKKFGEDIAILSGDALLSLAFQVMEPQVAPIVAKAIGSLGVVGGQVVDMQLARKEITMDQELIDYIHTHKTGALFKAATHAGALIAGASPAVVQAMSDYGHHIGYAFQIIDDVFDGDNYVQLVGAEKSMEEARRMIALAKEKLRVLDCGEQSILNQLADYVADRKE